tara:strand:+ start:844 stop:1509 length:666 start_codon:yes stop_codon:yes gene_type:complete
MEKTTFEKLSAINVNDKVEKKSGLTYLSWSYAWSETKRNCPDASYCIKGDPITQKPYFYDESLGYLVMTEVTIEGKSLEMWLPVMDGANKAMKSVPYSYTTRYGEKSVEAATMFDINKTLMRCLVKNLAMFGMGIYIYAGEDLPDTQSEATPVAKSSSINLKKEPTEELEDLKKGTENWNKVIAYVTANKELGMEKIGKQLTRKYKISPALKKEIANLITT